MVKFNVNRLIISQALNIVFNTYMSESSLIDYLFHVFVLQKKYLRIVSSVPVAKNVIKKWAETDLIAQVVSVSCFTLYITFFYNEFTHRNQR